MPCHLPQPPPPPTTTTTTSTFPHPPQTHTRAQVPCPWLGLASVGCAGRYCETYIKGTAAADLPSFFHELGHNQGLGHAGAHLDE